MSEAITKRSTFGIGASDIAAIAGQSKYASPWDVYLRLTEKRDLLEQADAGELGAVEVLSDLEDDDERDLYSRTGWGHRLEPVIRQAYADETGLEVVVPSSSIFHAEHAWARATPDGMATDVDVSLLALSLNNRTLNPTPSPRSLSFDADHDRLVQCKNVGQFVAREWADAPPDYVQLQEQWELYVTGLTRADVAALIGGGEFRVFTIWRDDTMISDLATIAEDFWRRVQNRQAPDVDASNACRSHIAGLLAGKQAVELVADVKAEQLAKRYQEYYLTEALAEMGKKLAVNEILSTLAAAGATKLKTEFGVIGTRRTPEKTVEKIDWEAIARAVSAELNVTVLDDLIAKHTATSIAPPRIALVAPRSWAPLKKGTEP